MRCKKCGNEIPDNSIYCNLCGTRQLAAPRTRAAGRRELTVPRPRLLPSGTWFIQLRLGGESISVTGATERACTDAAKVKKAQHIAGQKEKKRLAGNPTLKDACNAYIARRDTVLSPSTVNGYDAIVRTRFSAYMSKRISTIDYQRMVNDEASAVSAKTVKNAWGFVASVLRENGITPPAVQLPQLIKKELPWLDYQQIKIFLDAVKGQRCEIAALFALHGLRKSELLALTPKQVSGDQIRIAGAVVMGKDNKPVRKDTNKNRSSQRTVSVKIPRLSQLLDAWQGDDDAPYVTCNINTLHGQINAVCRQAGLPEVGVHGLRRSFASLAYHLGWSELETMKEGGWSDYRTMHSIYIKLAEKDETKAAKKMTKFYKKL